MPQRAIQHRSRSSYYPLRYPMNLPRVPEPEVMDSAQEATEYFAMDHAEVNRRFVDDLCEAGPVGPRVVDLGCGPGLIMIELCRRLDFIIAMGIDASVEMLELAKQEADLAGLIDRVQLAHADVKRMDEFSSEMADTVISNSLLHHLTEPAVALQTSTGLLRPGGRLFVRDLCRPDSERELEQLVERYAGNETGFAQQLLRQSLHAALTHDEMRSLCRDCGIDADHVQISSDRHWTLDWTKAEADAALPSTA